MHPAAESKWKRTYSRSLRYSVLETANSRLLSGSSEKEHKEEMKAVYRNLHEYTEGEEKDKSFWLLSQYNSTCASRASISIDTTEKS